MHVNAYTSGVVYIKICGGGIKPCVGLESFMFKVNKTHVQVEFVNKDMRLVVVLKWVE